MDILRYLLFLSFLPFWVLGSWPCVLADHPGLRQNVRLYEILQLAAVQMKTKQSKTHDLNPKEMLLAKKYRFFVQEIPNI